MGKLFKNKKKHTQKPYLQLFSYLARDRLCTEWCIQYWVKENKKYHRDVLFWSFGWLPVVRSGRKSQEINLTPPRTSLSTPGTPIPTRKPQQIPKTIPKKLPRSIFYPWYFLISFTLQDLGFDFPSADFLRSAIGPLLHAECEFDVEN